MDYFAIGREADLGKAGFVIIMIILKFMLM